MSIRGKVRPTGTYIGLTSGSSAAVSDAGEARIRYNTALNRIEVSENGSAYTPFGSGLQPSVDWYDAAGDGVTDDTASFQEAINTLPATGGIINIPQGRYLLKSPIDVGTKSVVFQGSGWTCNVQAPLGHAQWSDPSLTFGTVLLFDGCDGFLLSSAAARKIQIRDLCVLGDATALTVGISGTLTCACLHNVGVFNFPDGIVVLAVDLESFSLTVRGCTRGITFDASADCRFYGVDIQSNTVGIDIPQGSSLHFFGGVVQANGTGLKIAPSLIGGVSDSSFTGLWFEANTVAPFTMDTTNGVIQGITFYSCRCSDVYTFDPTLVNALGRLAMIGCDFAGITMNLRPIVRGTVSIANRFSAVNHLGDEDYACVASDNYQSKFCDSFATSTTPGASYTPDWNIASKYYLTLDENIVINPPDNAPYWSEVEFLIRQPMAGGKTVTWAAGYHATWSDAGNVGDAYSSVVFRCIPGGQWIQVGAQKPYGL